MQSGVDHTYKISVIIVNWNGAHFLHQCLTALMAQTVTPHEIILVDNASSDGSIAIARNFPSVRIIALQHNSGFARGNNIAINATSDQSEWIALLNPDAYAEPRWLEMLLLAAQSNPEFNIFGSRLINAGNPLVLTGLVMPIISAVGSGDWAMARRRQPLLKTIMRYSPPVGRRPFIDAALYLPWADLMRTTSVMWRMWTSVFDCAWRDTAVSMSRNP